MNDHWETQRVRLEQRMEQIKKEIEADPYAALFGRRLEPFKSSHKHENIFSSLFQSIFGQGSKAEAEPKTTDTTARVKVDAVHPSDTRPSDKQPASPGIEVNTYEEPAKDDTGGYEFDPITGRMFRKKGYSCEESRNCKHTETPNISIHSNTIQSDAAQSTGFLSPVDRSEQPDPKGVTKTGAHENTVQYGSVDGPSPQTTTQGPGEYAYGSSNLPAKPGNSDEDILKEPTEPQDESTAFAKEVAASDIETTNELLSTDHAHLEAHNVPPSAVSHQNEPSSSAPVQTQNPLATPRMARNEVKQHEEWITQAEKAEDLDILRASDIRTRYELEDKDQDSEEQLREKRRKLDLAYEMAKDPVKDLDAQRIRKKYEIHESSESKETVPEPPESPEPQSHSHSSTTASTSLPRAEEVFHNVSVDPNHGAEEQYNQVQVSPNDSWATTTYRVLVYDPSSSQVMEAETSSSLQSTAKLLSPAEVLSRLSHPAKFVPYLAKMHNDGYEIVSGGEDIIVFRQASKSGSVIRDGLAAQLASAQSDHDEDIRAATAPSDVSPNPAIESNAEASKDTGHAKARSRVRTALRRMLIGGVATAGTCYAIGVVVEYFRTGGQDGLGIDGFTEFESERRHRDRE
ncbi:hypothetical protein CNMCM5793_000446 [Aspergillus hiratsukae]|uniref:Uncharacterized protein n=1 Tax=Aspergillus hiratsukae TaxID=1194566 RepID=A0A8H6PA79_9EURO|nr:hypothetical protein CNMCM5793_000446 [Aspergillus hiratsukae]KAF7161982.1 hypothetical protein CNMCM6106_009063 [Aspergillus hiratsukae]